MDFGLDNEFESDDSFFDEPKLKSKKSEKKTVEDIFGFPEKKSGHNSLENLPNSPGKPKVRFDVTESKLDKAPNVGTTNKPKNFDWLGSSDADIPKKTPASSKSDFLDDIFSGSVSKKSTDILNDILPRSAPKAVPKKPATFEDILKESRVQNNPEKSVSDANDGGSFILEPPKEKRRGRRGSSGGVEDVLGLFGDKKDDMFEEKRPKTTEAASLVDGRGTKKAASEVPDWLGGGGASSTSTFNKSETTISSHKSTDDVITEPPIAIKTAEEKNVVVEETAKNNIGGDFQNSISNLQTQESFLLVSMQLKKYEENLREIKSQQQEMLKKQESQFDVFLDKYVEKQKNIEKDVWEQQERINSHIRALSVNLGPDSVEKSQPNEEEINNIVQALKQRHIEEFFIMEESYKKQISLVEKSSESIEQRLNQELQSISKMHEEKLEQSNKLHQEEIEFWTEKLKNIAQKHSEETESLRETHSRVLREVKDEFLEQIERFKEGRNREASLFEKGLEFSQKIESGLEKIDHNGSILENLQDKVVNDYNILSAARENSIEAKEKEIVLMRTALEKSRDQAEKDRSQLLGLVRILEQKIAEQNHNSQEERWALQQAAATIAARSAAFDREAEFSRASIEREREQLKTLKETLLAEQEKTTIQLTEDKLRLSAEKSRLEVSAKLVNNYEVEKIRTEAETAIEVAKELTEKLNRERDHVQRQKNELDNFRRKLVEKERELLEREEDIEETRRNTLAKMNEDRRVVQEAKFLENRYKEKLSELQLQTVSLSSREKKMAEEKLLLSKERLALYTAAKQDRKCMLCRVEGDKNAPLISGLRSETMFLEHHPGLSDPEIFKLRLEAEEERNSEVSREENPLS